MSKKIQYTAITGMVNILTGNSHLDGTTGSYETLITSTSNGTVIKTILIKATDDTTNGMIRFFVNYGGKSYLLLEVSVPNSNKSETGKDPTFQIVLPQNYSLQSGESIIVSTKKSESFNIICEGLSWDYGTDTKPIYTSNTKGGSLTSVDTLYKILTASSSTNGCEISSIVFKALE